MFSKIKIRIISHRKQLLGVSYYFAASLFSALIHIVLNPFIALNMEHKDYAITGFFASFDSLLSPFIAFSLVNYYTRKFFQLGDDERGKLRNSIVLSTVVLSGGMSLVSFGGLYTYFRYTGVNIPFYPFALMSITSLFMKCFYSLLLVDLKMGRNAAKFFWISICHAVCTALMSVVFVIVLQWGAYGKMLGLMLGSVIFGIYAFFKTLSSLQFEKKYLIQSLAFCWPLTIAAMLNYFFMGVDRIILVGLDDTRNLGLYNIAVLLTGYLAIFGNALSSSFQPDIFKSIADKKKKKTIKIIAGLLLLKSVPVVTFIIFAPLLIHVLTFGRFSEAAGFARILSLTILTSGAYFGLSSILIGYGYSKAILFIKLAGSILSAFMFKYLIANYGFYGAAWGQVCSFLIIVCIGTAFVAILKSKEILVYTIKLRKTIYNLDE
ncbi:putative polysaccharide biosynthesis protein CpsL [Chitinispirillum alkaliphilum]|nr:putative polysaccharide biosynthesis protein CpsL [Chitinispirillum alkaliphilum]